MIEVSIRAVDQVQPVVPHILKYSAQVGIPFKSVRIANDFGQSAIDERRRLPLRPSNGSPWMFFRAGSDCPLDTVPCRLPELREALSAQGANEQCRPQYLEYCDHSEALSDYVVQSSWKARVSPLQNMRAQAYWRARPEKGTDRAVSTSQPGLLAVEYNHYGTPLTHRRQGRARWGLDWPEST